MQKGGKKKEMKQFFTFFGRMTGLGFGRKRRNNKEGTSGFMAMSRIWEQKHVLRGMWKQSGC